MNTSGGGINVANLQGRVKVRTQGGGLDFDHIEGSVDGQTEGGGIRAAGGKAKLLIATQGGGITIKAFAGPEVRATTQGGSISADFAVAPKSACELVTEGGSISATIPGTAAVTLDATPKAARSGRICRCRPAGGPTPARCAGRSTAAGRC